MNLGERLVLLDLDLRSTHNPRRFPKAFPHKCLR
jgi:hypothetical protein